MKLSVLIPIYNAQSTIDDVIDHIFAAPIPENMTIEIIAINDGSSDSSIDKLNMYAEEDNRVLVFNHQKNMGKGAAIRTAVKHATGDIAVIQYAGLEYDPKDYTQLLRPILEKGADVVYGTRFGPEYYRHVLLYKHFIANGFITGFSNIFTNLNLTDMNTGFKAFRINVLKTMPLRSNRAGFDPEITAKVAKRRMHIFEVPIKYESKSYDGEKKMRWLDTIVSITTIIKFWIIDDLYKNLYGEETLRSMELASRFTNWVVESVRPSLKGTILEVGSGIGNNIKTILGGNKVIATDCDPEYLRMLNNTFAERRNVSVCEWDATKTPPDAVMHVDSVYCSNVLEHIQDDDAAINNIYKVLNKDGEAVLIVPAGEHLHGSIDTALGHVRRYDLKQFTEKLTAAGFKIKKAYTMNKVGVIGWWLNGRVLKRTALNRFQLKLFNMLIPIIKHVDPILPWNGLSLVVIAKKTPSHK